MTGMRNRWSVATGLVAPSLLAAVGGQPLTVTVVIGGSKFHGFGDYPASETAMTIQAPTAPFSRGRSGPGAPMAVNRIGAGT